MPLNGPHSFSMLTPQEAAHRPCNPLVGGGGGGGGVGGVKAKRIFFFNFFFYFVSI